MNGWQYTAVVTLGVAALLGDRWLAYSAAHESRPVNASLPLARAGAVRASFVADGVGPYVVLVAPAREIRSGGATHVSGVQSVELAGRRLGERPEVEWTVWEGNATARSRRVPLGWNRYRTGVGTFDAVPGRRYTVEALVIHPAPEAAPLAPRLLVEHSVIDRKRDAILGAISFYAMIVCLLAAGLFASAGAGPKRVS